MELLIFKQDSPSYNFMWNWLANHPINAGIDNPMVALNEGEVWQNMGSFRQGDVTVTQFRHRCHPKTNERKSLSVTHPKIIPDEDIEEKYNTK
jgi:hypothetical protein